MEIAYTGEHLLPGNLGAAFVWISFLTSLSAAALYYLSFRKNDTMAALHKGARLLYYIHTATLVAVGALLYFLIFNHYFEYSYVWQYSSRSLPVEYIISCFWAGQEGSFLVWAIWQALVGLIVLIYARNWESPVMAVFSLSQAFVTSMLLGVKIAGLQIGATPFELLRETVGSIEGTIFTMPDYVSMIEDGNGLNPLLENIWMTIHPPILFLGYALALVPFSYAIASLMRKDYHSWISRAIPWTLVSMLMLGAGILLGGAWAYVSLTFGGFWAWDPVENSSLIPWMTLVAGLHLMIIARRQNFALFSSYLMLTLSYVLVLYASFLTRSGVLANTSAHSFGENGMTAQLLVFLLSFLFLTVIMIAMNYRKLQVEKRDQLFSREFWMFTGTVIMVLAAFQILFSTSIPVVNSIFGSNIAPPSDPVSYYNRWQMPFALLVAAFIGFTQIMKYQENDLKTFLKRLWIPALAALALLVPMVTYGVVRQVNLVLFVFFILLAFFITIGSLFVKTTRPRNISAIITHIGFILFLLGTVITFSNSETISTNTSRYDLGSETSNSENLVLMKNDTLFMSGYYVSYVDKKVKGNTTHYRVDFMKYRNGKYFTQFTLHPSVNVHPKMGAVYNPATRNFLLRDYYTYIASVSDDPDYIVLKVMMNPYINVLWLGSLVMIAGFAISLYRRTRRLWVVTRR